MQRLPLGGQGLTVSKQGLGCMGMSQSYGPADLAESQATLERALELGITFFDTANAYGLGHNEQLLGDTLGAHRDSIEIATKFGIAGIRDGRMLVDGRPEYARQCCDESLARLGTDRIDLYYLHRVDKQVPIEETVGAMAELVAAGKVRFIGLSEAAPSTIRRAHAVHPITALQSEYSLFEREPERSVLPTLRELGIGFVPFCPLGRGMLSGAVPGLAELESNDARQGNPRWQGDNFTANFGVVERIAALAAARRVTTAQLALAWVHAQGDDLIPIPGTKRRTWLADNAAAAELELDEALLAAIDEAAPLGIAAGQRYVDMSAIDRDD
jgi:aryl-alcohol dehydrogenase-like predicted oxidoreductase